MHHQQARCPSVDGPYLLSLSEIRNSYTFKCRINLIFRSEYSALEGVPPGDPRQRTVRLLEMVEWNGGIEYWNDLDLAGWQWMPLSMTARSP